MRSDQVVGDANVGVEHQPYLHDDQVLVAAPTFALIAPDGGMTRPEHGVFHRDRRILSTLIAEVSGYEVVPLLCERESAESVRVLEVLRNVGDGRPDPVLTMQRRLRVGDGCLAVEIEISNADVHDATIPLTITTGSDLAPVESVKQGRPVQPIAAVSTDRGLVWRVEAQTVTASFEIPAARSDAASGTLSGQLVAPAGSVASARLLVTVEDREARRFLRPATPAPWRSLEVTGEARLARLVSVALDDLEALLLEDALGDPGRDRFVAAGAPWFLTLFGRDTIWSASMLLPISGSLADGTLRTLAREQGRSVERETAEAPGKIIHELRRASGGEGLPARYYGTIDATPLFVGLVHDAWRWGADASTVEPLLDAVEAALEWMREDGDPDRDGMLEYIDASGKGLANQGWRDSFDSIRWRDGRLAAAPVALAEVQAYAHRAAVVGADLLDAFGRPGAERWRDWAALLRRRFAAQFWVDGPLGRVPAVALDGAKQAVDSITSGLGHLLGTGLLDPLSEAAAVRYLSSPSLDSGYGIRTLSKGSVGFNPLGYHTGSVWPHDNAIVARGLESAGYGEAAWSVVSGILDASDSFDARLPELFGGHGRTAGRPAPYPAACRPQGWSAAAAIELCRVVLGLHADVPGGRLAVGPVPGGPRPFGVRGLRLGPHRLDVAVDENGGVTVETDAPVEVTITSPQS